MKYLMHGCQNYSLRVPRSSLRRVPDYEGKFLKFHWNILGMVVKTTVYVFRGAHWEQLSFFLTFFQNCFRTLSDNRPHLLWKVSTAFPNVHSTWPKDFFVFFLWMVLMFFFKLRTQAKKILVLKEKFRHFCWNCI